MVQSILGSPVHVVEEDGVTLPRGEPQLVRQVLLIGRAEDVDRDEILLQLAQTLLGLLDRQACDEAPSEARTWKLFGAGTWKLFRNQLKVK